MATSKHIDRICCAALVLALIAAVLLMGAGGSGIAAGSALGYEDKLFDASAVHTIDIAMDDWDGFIAGCEDEEYVLCDVTIDGEMYRNVGIRAKGNTSLSSVSSLGSSRYSFKIEFDHYDDAISYHGLDKLSLNNIIQDNTYMKDFLCYRMMSAFGADAPLCSYSYITVNGSDWGLYLAVEGVEDSFLQRNYGSDWGELYKPDSSDMGGGRGNGGGFDMENFDISAAPDQASRPENMPDMGNMQPPDMEGRQPDGMDTARGSSDVSLIYSGDDPDSYSNIFDNAKTDVSDADKARLIEALRKLGENEDIASVVDVDEVMRYFVVHNFVCNFDSYTGSMIHNYYLYEEDGQLSMIPWDYNLAFGSFQSESDASGLVNYPIDTPVSGGTVQSRPMLAWIFSNEEYTGLYHEYFAEFISQMFDSGEFEELLDSTGAMIAPYVEKDPTKFCTYEEFEAGIGALREFCLLRAESVRGQLEGAIPSTAEAQAADGSALIDASALNISDMGGMDKTMGGRGGQTTAPDESTRPGMGGAEPEGPRRFTAQGAAQIP